MEQEGITLSDSEGKPIVLTQVRDSYNKMHKLTKILGQGGQGMVCCTENPEIVVKFVLNNGQLIDKNTEAYEQNDSVFKSIVYKPFPNRIHIAFPMARLTDYSGYVMRFMGDMHSFSELVPHSHEDMSRMAHDGGHRRRFELLAKLAAIMAKLHGVGMVYCDLSPNNVFVTEKTDISTQNVWLIDADNVFIPGEDARKMVYTPRYAAPELFAGKACNMAGDVYSLATLAFESLAAIHPFAGDKATNADDAGAWDASTADETVLPDIDPCYSGKFPWIEDVEDKDNHTSRGLPRQNFLTNETFALFNMTFSIEGREQPTSRPTASLFARAFAQSHATSVKCPKCDMSFVYDGELKVCPWCEAPMPSLVVLRDDAGCIVFAHELSLTHADYGEKFALPEHIFAPFHIDSFLSSKLELRPKSEANQLAFEFIKKFAIDNYNFYIDDDEIRSRYCLLPQRDKSYLLKCEINSLITKVLSIEFIIDGGQNS